MLTRALTPNFGGKLLFFYFFIFFNYQKMMKNLRITQKLVISTLTRALTPNFGENFDIFYFFN
jgi:hypothetical protein